jgi:hypothetical protein
MARERQAELMSLLHAGAEVREHAVLKIVADIDVHGDHVRTQAQGFLHRTDQGLVVRGQPVPGASREVHDKGLVEPDVPGVGHDHALVQDHALGGQVLHPAQQAARDLPGRVCFLRKDHDQGGG